MEARTGRDGSFDLGDIDGASGITATAPGYTLLALRTESMDLRRETLYRQVVLQRAPSIRGTVIDALGRPVPGASIYGTSVAVSDGSGQFHLTDLPPVPSLRLMAKADGLAPGLSDRIELTPGVEIDGVVIRLGLGSRVTGQVVGRNGQPREGVKIELEPLDNTLFGPRETTTDRCGCFEMSGIAAGQYRLRVARSRSGPISAAEVLTLSEGKQHHLGTLHVP